MNKKEFIISQLAEYFQDSTKCGYEGDTCMNITSDGKMCVAGKNLLPEMRDKYPKADIETIFTIFGSQSNFLRPEAVDILTLKEWMNLQFIHDSLANGYTLCTNTISILGFESPEDLKNQCLNYKIS